MGDRLYIYRERAETAWYTGADGATRQLQPGSLVVYPSALSAYKGGIAPGRDFDFQYAAIPLSTLSRLGDAAALAGFRHLPGDAPFAAMISSYFATWCDRLPLLTPAEAEHSIQTLLHLLAVGGGAADPREASASLALSVARRQAAESYIASQFRRPDLAPGHVARHLGISVRQLHLDFETGPSVARTIAAARLQAAQQALAAPSPASITEIAFSCGFDGFSTFYRLFKTATGMTASEYRRTFSQTSEKPS
jgi:AraC-like DNA-binding protein